MPLIQIFSITILSIICVLLYYIYTTCKAIKKELSEYRIQFATTFDDDFRAKVEAVMRKFSDRNYKYEVGDDGKVIKVKNNDEWWE